MFQLYDKDKSGQISQYELMKALEKTGLSKEEIREVFNDADKSGDGKIGLDEFIGMMEATG
eukprot:5489215-Prymnesium_polylepis.1